MPKISKLMKDTNLQKPNTLKKIPCRVKTKKGKNCEIYLEKG